MVVTAGVGEGDVPHPHLLQDGLVLEKLCVESVAYKGTCLESLRLSEVVGMETASLFLNNY